MAVLSVPAGISGFRKNPLANKIRTRNGGGWTGSLSADRETNDVVGTSPNVEHCSSPSVPPRFVMAMRVFKLQRLERGWSSELSVGATRRFDPFR